MRNICCKCPHYYEQHGYECDDVDWGCTAFGLEFENCPSFDDGEGNSDFEEWGCNEKQNRIDYARNKIKRKSRALCKIGEAKKNSVSIRKFIPFYQKKMKATRLISMENFKAFIHANIART